MRDDVAGSHRAREERRHGAEHGVRGIAVGVVSFLFNPFFIISIASVGNAVFVFRRIADDQGRGEAIPSAAARRVAVTVIGALLGLASLVHRLFANARLLDAPSRPNEHSRAGHLPARGLFQSL